MITHSLSPDRGAGMEIRRKACFLTLLSCKVPVEAKGECKQAKLHFEDGKSYDNAITMGLALQPQNL